MNCIEEERALNGMIFAQREELFARVPLDEQLSEDTDAGESFYALFRTFLETPGCVQILCYRTQSMLVRCKSDE